MRAVVIEDSRTQAHRLRTILEKRGFVVEVALDGESGLAVCGARAGEIDLVVSDVVMPGIDGFEVCRRLKSNPATSRIAVMLLTGSTDSRDVVRALAAGADNFVGKPYDENDLWDRVQRTLARRSSEAPLQLRFRDEMFRIDASREQMLEIFASTLDDMTSRTEKLREAEQRYRFLAESIPQLTWTTDASGRMDYANRGFLDYSGMTLEQLAASGSQTFSHPDDYAVTKVTWAEAMLAGKPFEAEHRMRHVSGSAYRWFLTRALPMRDDAGTIVRWFGTSTDIDLQKRTQDGLAFLENASAQLASSLDLDKTLQNVTSLAVPTLADCCAVLLQGDDGELRLVAITHVDQEKAAQLRELLERPSVDPLTGERTRPDLVALLQQIGATSSIDIPLVQRSGTFGALLLAAVGDRVLDATDRRLADELSRRTAVAIENAQLFRLAQLERAREEQANRAKDEFLAMVSHELRTPLNAITGWAALLTQREPTPAILAKGLATIERNAKAQGKLIEEILDVSRIITGKLTIDRRPLDLRGLVQSTVESQGPIAKERDISLGVTLTDVATTVEGDAYRLQQVLSNLLGNALKFTPAGGHVAMRLGIANGHAEVSVTDDGVGISPSFLPHVFERFRQGDSSISRSAGGLGLGLAIVQHLVRLHGGAVSATSEGEGKGATFTVRLPLIAIDPVREPSPSSHPRRSGAALAGIDIVLVDDDDDSREAVAHFLVSEGASIRQASSAEEALGHIRERLPAVLVTDIGMPIQDGYSLLLEVRELAKDKTPPALALTAYAGAEDEAAALRAGFQQHLAKPLQPQQLVDAIARIARASQR